MEWREPDLEAFGEDVDLKIVADCGLSGASLRCLDVAGVLAKLGVRGAML